MTWSAGRTQLFTLRNGRDEIALDSCLRFLAESDPGGCCWIIRGSVPHCIIRQASLLVSLTVISEDLMREDFLVHIARAGAQFLSNLLHHLLFGIRFVKE